MYEHLIGQPGTLEMVASRGHRYQVAVLIVDVRRVYGRTEFLVRPAAGGGEAVWVTRDRVRVTGGTP